MGNTRRVIVRGIAGVGVSAASLALLNACRFVTGDSIIAAAQQRGWSG